MLNEKDRVLIDRLASENPEVSYVLHLMEEEHREMLSFVSHEIRNPLTLISSSLQFIEGAHPEAKDFRFWPQLREDVRELRLLLEDLSAYNNASSIKKEPVELYPLIRSTADAFLPQLHTQHISLDLPDHAALPTITGDAVKLRQVFTNLLKNAAEALTDRADGKIQISFRTEPGSVSISIRDNGSGILPELREQIFQPFRTFKPNGTGLGLPVSRQIIRAHGGELSLDPIEIEGASFTVTLPV